MEFYIYIDTYIIIWHICTGHHVTTALTSHWLWHWSPLSHRGCEILWEVTLFDSWMFTMMPVPNLLISAGNSNSTVNNVTAIARPSHDNSQSQFKKFLFRKEIYIERQNILTATHDQDWSVNLWTGSHQGRLQ